jgi:kynurenine 3-monooxygenase
VKKPEHVVIAGAGLVGALLATMLARRGYRVSVYEKRSDLRATRISAGKSINLALAERGIHALRIAGLMDEVEPLLIPMRGRMLHELDGVSEFSPYGQRPHEVIYSVSRLRLNQIMLDAVETVPKCSIGFLQEATAVDFASRQANFGDATSRKQRSVPFDFLIGADGSGSAVRQALIRDVQGEDHSEFLDHDYKELCIPAGPNGEFQLTVDALHIWPRGGFMLIALPNLDGSFTVTLFLPRTGECSFEGLKSADQVRSFFERYFPDAANLIPDLTSDFFENPTGQMGTVRCWPWIIPDAAMLIGDAAHAVVPFHGQGMNCGFEDCSEWIRLLDKHAEDWSAAMAEFQQIRKPNCDAIAKMALENYIVMRDGVREPDYHLKKEVGFALERMFPDRFIPRYSMVMFHRIPYRIALERGVIQERILRQLIAGIQQADQLDRAQAAALINAQLGVIEETAETQ